MINVTKTFLPDIKKYNNYVKDIFESGWITNNGKYLGELEKRLEEYLEVKNLVLVSNGTLALQLAYKLLGVKGEAITTPFSFVATASSLIWEGIDPIFADIDEESFCIDPSKIEDKITNSTKAIVPVHVFGNCCDVERIDYIAKKYNLSVIYDAAHAFGVNYKGKSLLEYGDISVLSFHATKIFHTIEGGALIINDDELYKRAKLMINFGIQGPEDIQCLGINAKMNEFQAVMGLSILDNINELIEERKEIYEYYVNKLSCVEGVALQKIHDCLHYNYSYFSIVFISEKILLKVMEELNKNEIYPRRYFYPSLNKLSYLNKKDQCPISEKISERILCLPIYPGITTKEQELIIDIVKKNIKN
ncbi:DegT/DnrJ/EryC1/StrS aminotransferase [Clostridium bornimense]|uniref:DegT/DnrJ/EryC1/StrS aminotransferase n=1 Tax=Clostridium bornimense TaxID=1216932 RepID=W6RWT3_9CLOT|nr:DegT/DnrJ/EryC1/StrS family aminotransferase [Clostridium bornimense]CDM68823.1 DegT/DnrJ/EryC1/StrS aminotransferase [Clostridium bornimense]